MSRWSNLFLFLIMIVLPLPTLAFEDGESRWYKGNLHTHSLWSDGNDFPEMIVKWYADRDYHFLALTDHNVLSNFDKWMNLDKIEARGDKQVLSKYLASMGEDWVETKEIHREKSQSSNASAEQSASKPQTLVRLKKLAEYRPLFEKPGQFLLMTGEEISDSVDGLPVHMNATNLTKLIRPAGGQTVRDAIRNNMRQAIEQSRSENRQILVHLNHPNFGWAVTAEDLAHVVEEQFFEIYNGHPQVRQLGDDTHPGLEKIWDIANTIRIDRLKSPPLMGLATDDSHNYHGRPGSQPGRGWIMVRADQLKPESLLTAINHGQFYASSGVILRDIAFDAETKTVTIEIEPVEGHTFTTKFVGTPKEYDRTSEQRTDENGKPMRTTRVYSPDVGKTFAEVSGPQPSYRLTGNELYVRAIISSSADHPNPSFSGQQQQAWTQPLGWEDQLTR